MYIRSLDEGGGSMGAMYPLFLKLYFARNVLWEVCFCVIIQGIRNFLVPHSQNVVVGLYVVWQNSFNLARSGYGFFDFPLTHISK